MHLEAKETKARVPLDEKKRAERFEACNSVADEAKIQVTGVEKEQSAAIQCSASINTRCNIIDPVIMIMIHQHLHVHKTCHRR